MQVKQTKLETESESNPVDEKTSDILIVSTDETAELQSTSTTITKQQTNTNSKNNINNSIVYTTNYVLLTKGQSYKYSVSPTNKISTRLDECYTNNDQFMSCVAIGRSSEYALICKNGAAYYKGPVSFKSKMREIDCTKIKHISFGTNNQWAITMNNGYCYGILLPELLKIVDKYNGNISYVSLSGDNKNSWIVGYQKNNFFIGSVISDYLNGFLTGLSAAKSEIKLVELGSNGHYFVYHENGAYWTLPKGVGKWFKSQNSKFQSISLY